MSHEQLMIAPGVYVTDFRKNAKLVGISEQKNVLTNDVGLLLDDCKAIESKCKMLQYSIEEIKKEDNWQEDPDFCQAIEEDWAVIIRLSKEMKQRVLRLYELKYQPEDSKIEDLLNIDRIQTRQSRAHFELLKIQPSQQKVQSSESKQQGIYL